MDFEVIEAAYTLLRMKHSKQEVKRDSCFPRTQLRKQMKKQQEVKRDCCMLRIQLTKEMKQIMTNCKRKNLEESEQKVKKATAHCLAWPQLTEEIRQLIVNYKPPNIPDVPSNIRDIIGMSIGPFEKQLTNSDIDKTQNRLSMNREDVRKCIESLLKPNEDPDEGIEVNVYDIEGKEYKMVYKVWVQKVNVLIGGWRNFVEDHGFKKLEDFVTVWAFRHATTDRLCFVISARRLPVFRPVNFKR